MDPHAVNPMAMQPMSMPMGMQQPMSMPMATGAAANNAGNGGPNPAGVQMGMGMNPMAGVAGGAGQYGVPPQQQQQMMMNMSAMNAGGGGGMNPQQMGMNPQQMNAMKMGAGSMNPVQMGVGGQVMGADWRIQLTREHRANLIAKMYVYFECVREDDALLALMLDCVC